MLPRNWKPVPVGPLLRLGSRQDGGYTIPVAALEPSRLLLSMGLSDDWSFEEDFHKRTGARVICFDGSVTGRFWIKHGLSSLLHGRFSSATRYLAYRRFFGQRGVEHRRQMVGYDGNGSVSLATVLAELPEVPIFLKCDIEGSEYRIFDDLAANAGRFTAIAMELHDVDLHRERISALLAQMPQFVVADLHGNNFAGTNPAGDPMVLEITLLRRDLVDSKPAGIQDLGDRRNDPSRPELELLFEDDSR